MHTQLIAGLVLTLSLGMIPDVQGSQSSKEQINKARCIEVSLEKGAPHKKRLRRCYEKYTQRLIKDYRRTKEHRGSGFDQDMRFGGCDPYFSIRGVPPVSNPDFDANPALSKSCLERFQKRLIPYGKKVANCYASLAKGTVPLPKLKKGKLLVELEVGIDGVARQIVLTEPTALDGHVVGCVVRELCGFWAAPPPGGKPFYLELPFTFKKPK